MSIATVVTRGYGSFGTIADVVTRGYVSGEAATPSVSGGGGSSVPGAGGQRDPYQLLSKVRIRKRRPPRRLFTIRQGDPPEADPVLVEVTPDPIPELEDYWEWLDEHHFDD